MTPFLEKIPFTTSIPFKMFKDNDIIGPHCHPQVEFIYSKNGITNIGIDNALIELHTGEIVFFSPGQTHYFLPSPNSERYVLLFDLSILNSSFLTPESEKELFTFFEDRVHFSGDWPLDLQKKVQTILDSLYHKISDLHHPNYELLVIGMISLLSFELMEGLPKKEEAGVQLANRYQDDLVLLNEIVKFVKENYCERITIKTISDHIGFNQYYFTKFFKKLTGKTFMTFLNDYRIQQAKYILANEKFPMSEVSARSGFESIKTFHHSFKSRVGQSPLQYQKSLNQK